MIHSLRSGFETLSGVDDAVLAVAEKNIIAWLDDDTFSVYHPQLRAMIEAGDFEHLVDAFYQVIPFGTGGRRGAVGIGTNRINPWTFSTSVQGHVNYLQRRFKAKEGLSVVIAYDVRRFQDLRGRYQPGVDMPLLGLTSRGLAELAASVYAANGVIAHLQPDGDERYMSTPELAFAIRHLDANAGLNVSASHNHPDDNGGKFYNHLGGQEIPPDDSALVGEVAKVQRVQTLSYSDASASEYIQWLSEDVHQAYIDHVASLTKDGSNNAKVVFTALHGTGGGSVVEVLRQKGFSVHEVASQATADGSFPTVPFRAPNPEVPESMSIAVSEAEMVDADLVLATDPDADRIGAVVRHKGEWRHLSGNEIATLVVDHALNIYTGEAPLVVQTEVTTGFVARMARARGATVIDHLLVGFKYIGDVIRKIDEDGCFGGVNASLSSFVAGVEESHGVLVSPYIRDKDAAGGGLYLAEAASLALASNQTLIDRLEELWSKYGYVTNKLASTVMQGAAGKAMIEAVQDSFRESPPDKIGGLEVTAFHDRQNPNGPFGEISSDTDAASRNVLVFELTDKARVILRPSGTEPKNKAYVEYRGEKGVSLDAEIARVEKEAGKLAISFVDEMLGRAGIELPNWAHSISGLVPVEGKVAFVALLNSVVVNILAGKTITSEQLSDSLSGYGDDALALFGPAVEQYLQSSDLASDVSAHLRSLFGLI